MRQTHDMQLVVVVIVVVVVVVVVVMACGVTLIPNF